MSAYIHNYGKYISLTYSDDKQNIQF